MYTYRLPIIISEKTRDTLTRRRKREMKIKPLHDRILVKRLDEEEKTSGGIIIPESAKEAPAEGRVISVGPGRTDDSGKIVPMGVKEGDRILFSKYSGSEVKIEGVEHLIMKEDEVLGVVEGAPEPVAT
jgi:chaperonin GroES